MKTLVRATVLGLGLLAAACSNDSSTSQNQALNPLFDRDAALVAGDATAEDVAAASDPGNPSAMTAVGSAAFAPASPPGGFYTEGCTFNPTSQRLECQPVQRDGLTIQRSFQFTAANGSIQQAFDRLATAAANVTADVSGQVARENWTATVDRHRDLTATGLSGHETERTWNGTGNGTVARSKHTDGTETRTYDITYTTGVNSVVVPVPHTADSWPLSGSITREMSIKIEGGPRDGQTVERTATVTFNDTQFVPITINGKTFTFDLKTRHVIRDN
ncbi:MAG: hypothetical protein ABI647_07775 [Gemmatimonadota bacterium]